MVGCDLRPHRHVLARREHGNSEARLVVPLLPKVQTSGIVVRSGPGSTGSAGVVLHVSLQVAIRGRLWLGLEVTGHAGNPIVPELVGHVVFAERLYHPPMASSRCRKQSHDHGLHGV